MLIFSERKKVWSIHRSVYIRMILLSVATDLDFELYLWYEMQWVFLTIYYKAMLNAYGINTSVQYEHQSGFCIYIVSLCKRDKVSLHVCSSGSFPDWWTFFLVLDNHGWNRIRMAIAVIVESLYIELQKQILPFKSSSCAWVTDCLLQKVVDD